MLVSFRWKGSLGSVRVDSEEAEYAFGDLAPILPALPTGSGLDQHPDRVLARLHEAAVAADPVAERDRPQ